MRSFLTVVNLNNLIFIFLRFSVITLRKVTLNYKKLKINYRLKIYDYRITAIKSTTFFLTSNYSL